MMAQGEFGVTIYGNAGKSVRLLRGVPLQCVMLHTWPDPTDATAVREVRAAFGDKVLLDFGIPGNTLADDTESEIRQKAQVAVKSATDFGARYLQLNCEKAEKKGYPGWLILPQDPQRIRNQAKLVVSIFQEEIYRVKSNLRLSFTSHDWPLTHRLPWEEFLGEESSVVAHDTQVYPGIRRPGASFSGVRKRLAATRAQWSKMDRVKKSLRPGVSGFSVDTEVGEGFGVYHQGWGMSPQSMIFLGTRNLRSRMWSFPDDLWVTEGVLAAFVLAYLRSAFSEAVNPVENFQSLHQLTVDGIFGQASARALFNSSGEFVELARRVFDKTPVSEVERSVLDVW